MSSGGNRRAVPGILAFFIEQRTGSGQGKGRLIRTTDTGESCASGATNGGFAIACATPERTAS